MSASTARAVCPSAVRFRASAHCSRLASGVRVHERRENALDCGQHLWGVNDPFVGGLRPLNGSMDDPHHGQDRDDGEYRRSAKCA